MAIGHQSKQSHDKAVGHASTGAHEIGPGKQTRVQALAADAQGPAGGGVEAEAAKAGHHHLTPKEKTENEAVFELGEFSQRVKDAYDNVIDRVGRSKNLQQAASAALGAAGSLLADKVGAEVGKGVGLVIGKITDKIADLLGEKFPEVGGDKSAAGYLSKTKDNARHIIHHEAQTIPDHHNTMADLHTLLRFLRSDAAKKEGIAHYVDKKLADYQNSVELMYENSTDLTPVHGELVKESPVLGRVPDPARGNAVHLAVVQATKHNIPGQSKLTTWAFLHFIPNGLGPEANAVMDSRHHGQPILNFKLKEAGQLSRGLVTT